jgi:phosphoribosylaminoimidazole-succinocarboxamide synthase
MKTGSLVKKSKSGIAVTLLPFDGIMHLMKPLCSRLRELDIEAQLNEGEKNPIQVDFRSFHCKSSILLFELVEHVIQQIPIDFLSLPALLEGESKILRLLNSKIVIEQFKPTVYSYTHNRYGEVEGTAELRILFTAEIFRRMNRYSVEHGKKILKNAFLAVIDSPEGPLLVQEKVDACNLEVRVKGYHIGSPVHRYKYTEKFPTVQKNTEPLRKWSKFDRPIVCFDWRLPLKDDDGNRLADEPISDDYASVWMQDVQNAKELARETFIWMETLFSPAGLLLVDICFFIDKTGEVIFGEISPDCMRVKSILGNPEERESFDKDLWREGEKKQLLSERYERLFTLLFNQTVKIQKSWKT